MSSISSNVSSSGSLIPPSATAPRAPHSSRPPPTGDHTRSTATAVAHVPSLQARQSSYLPNTCFLWSFICHRYRRGARLCRLGHVLPAERRRSTWCERGLPTCGALLGCRASTAAPSPPRLAADNSALGPCSSVLRAFDTFHGRVGLETSCLATADGCPQRQRHPPQHGPGKDKVLALVASSLPTLQSDMTPN